MHLNEPHLCDNCEQLKRDQLEALFQRKETWDRAAAILDARDWPEDAKPLPADILYLARFLAGENIDD